MPAIAPPISGASQNTQSCAGAPSPLKKVTAVERAGLTDVLEIGMATRWITVSVSPMAKPATPTVVRPSVEPRMTNTNIAVKTISARQHFPLNATSQCRTQCDSGVEVPAGDRSERVDAGQHGKAERERNAKIADTQWVVTGVGFQ